MHHAHSRWQARALVARLTDAYAWHQAFWRSLPGETDARREFLSRLDVKDDLLEALLLSPEPPTAEHWGVWETNEVGASFLEHDRYYFSLRANPTVKRVVREEDGSRRKNGRRTASSPPRRWKRGSRARRPSPVSRSSSARWSSAHRWISAPVARARWSFIRASTSRACSGWSIATSSSTRGCAASGRRALSVAACCC